MRDWETELMRRVGSDKGWKLVEAFSRQMRALPDEVRAGAEILLKSLKEIGISPVVHQPEIYLGIPISATLTASGLRVSAKASALSPHVEGLAARPVHLKARPSRQGVHPGDPASLFERRFDSVEQAKAAVSGRIVITEGMSNPARTQLLQSWGAVGVIVINPGDRSHWGTNSIVWGSPVGDEINCLPKIASVAVSRAEGDALLSVAASGASVTLTVEALHGWFAQPVITAEIPGEGPEAQDYILLHSHYDSWEYGVGDNATGNAVLLEVARLFASNPRPFRRSVRLAWWPGHSAGRYAGSAWYAKAFADDLETSCLAHVNCDSPGCKDATSYASIRAMIEAAPLVERTVTDLFGQSCRITRPGRAGDYSFNNLGISGAMLTSSMVPKPERDRRGWYAVGGCGGNPAWHSEHDTLDVADREILDRDIRLYALLTARLANEETVPLDYRETLREIGTHIAAAAPDRLTADRAAALCDRLDDLVAALEAQELPHRDRNRLHRRLSRLAVRLNHAYGPPRSQDRARLIPPVPLLSMPPRDRDGAADPDGGRAVMDRIGEMERLIRAEA